MWTNWFLSPFFVCNSFIPAIFVCVCVCVCVRVRACLRVCCLTNGISLCLCVPLMFLISFLSHLCLFLFSFIFFLAYLLAVVNDCAYINSSVIYWTPCHPHSSHFFPKPPFLPHSTANPIDQSLNPLICWIAPRAILGHQESLHWKSSLSFSLSLLPSVSSALWHTCL